MDSAASWIGLHEPGHLSDIRAMSSTTWHTTKHYGSTPQGLEVDGKTVTTRQGQFLPHELEGGRSTTTTIYGHAWIRHGCGHLSGQGSSTQEGDTPDHRHSEDAETSDESYLFGINFS